jgi:hypothetical protein
LAVEGAKDVAEATQEADEAVTGDAEIQALGAGLGVQ